MNKFLGTFSALIITSLYVASAVAGSSTAALTSYIQNGELVNTSGAGVNMTEVVYSLGTPEDDLATWDSNRAGGVAEDFLTDTRYFQTVRWSGLNIAPGNSFTFGPLDIDELRTVNPLVVTGGVTGGNALRNGFILAAFSDGSEACAKLIEQDWDLRQDLVLTEGNVESGSCKANATDTVGETEPVPGLSGWSLALLAGLLLAFGLSRRRFV